MFAWSFNIDAPTATVLVGFFMFCAQVYNSFTLTHVKKLVNSNLAEVKEARAKAEEALATSMALNDALKAELMVQRKTDAMPSAADRKVNLAHP